MSAQQLWKFLEQERVEFEQELAQQRETMKNVKEQMKMVKEIYICIIYLWDGGLK